MHLAARLTESATGQPLAGRALAFVLGSQTATAVTGADGTATVEIVPAGLPGATPLAVAFAGEGAWSGSATNRLAVITPGDSVLSLSGISALASGAQPVSARLIDDDGQPVAGRTVIFKLGTVTAEALTGADGTATASLIISPLTAGTARLEAAFAGDSWYRRSSAATTVLLAQPTSFVIWGGNSPGLRIGDRVQFWGAQWSRQVQGGDYAAQADFKGWSNAPLPPRLCQPNAHTTGTPRLDASCWTSKPGNSNPPVKLGNYIQVIVSTSIAKSGSTIYGNTAATVVLQVDPTGYAPDPGHPGYGTVIAFLEGESGLSAPADIKAILAPAAPATRRISLYSPEMSLIAETELTTAARPAIILYEYIWFDGRPLAQVDGVGTVSWTFTDHLGTPLLQTSALQGIVWRAEHEPYGSIYALRSYDRHQPLRFPGQEAEQLGTGANGMTERSYNVHRWYRAGWGRYTQADPIQAAAFVVPYMYGGDNPELYTDQLGLLPRIENCDEACCKGDRSRQVAQAYEDVMRRATSLRTLFGIKRCFETFGRSLPLIRCSDEKTCSDVAEKYQEHALFGYSEEEGLYLCKGAFRSDCELQNTIAHEIGHRCFTTWRRNNHAEDPLFEAIERVAGCPAGRKN
jgi:RHS repeat-associated protein